MPEWGRGMRIAEIEMIKPKRLKAVTKQEDPLKRKADELRDKADQYSDQAKERKQRDDMNKARENLRDKEMKLVADPNK